MQDPLHAGEIVLWRTRWSHICPEIFFSSWPIYSFPACVQDHSDIFPVLPRFTVPPAISPPWGMYYRIEQREVVCCPANGWITVGCTFSGLTNLHLSKMINSIVTCSSVANKHFWSFRDLRVSSGSQVDMIFIRQAWKTSKVANETLAFSVSARFSCGISSPAT